MIRFKRILALVLVFSMVFSFSVFDVAAGQTAATAKVSLGSAEINAGETATLDLQIAGCEDLKAISYRIYYKSSELECVSISALKDSTGGPTAWKDYKTYVEETLEEDAPSVATNVNDTSNIPKERSDAGWKLASVGYVSNASEGFSATEAATMAGIKFKAKSDIESCESVIEVEVIASTPSMNCEITNGKIKIKGAAPTLASVELYDGEEWQEYLNAVVDGSTDLNFQAKAISTSGKDITSLVTWSVKDGDNDVTVAADGKVTVSKTARGMHYITATPDKDSKGDPKTIEIFVMRDVRVGSAALVDEAGKEVTEFTANGTADTTLTVAVKDQFGDKFYNFDAPSIKPANNASVKDYADAGVTITNPDPYAGEGGLPSVTISKNAKAGTYSFEFINSDRDAPVTFSIEVKREASYIKTFKLDNKDRDVSVTVKGGNEADQKIGITYYNQYGEAIDKPADVNMSINYTDQGVSFDADYKNVIVKNNAKTANYSIQAVDSKGNTVAVRGLNVSREASTVKRAQLKDESGSIIYDTTSYNVPTIMVSGKDRTFTITYFDQYGEVLSMPITGSSEYKLTAVPTDGTIVYDYQSGTITVKGNAKTSERSYILGINVPKGTSTLVYGVEFKVQRAKSAPAKVEVTVPQGEDSINVPANGASDYESSAFTVNVTDQFGDTVEKPDVTWSITDADGNSVDGITVSANGKITVTNAAKKAIKDATGTELKITATAGTVSGSAKVTVKRAPSLAETAELSDKDGNVLYPGSEGKPAKLINNGKDQTFTIKYYDQYGEEYTLPAGSKEYTLSKLPDVISYDFAKSEITVKGSAPGYQSESSPFIVGAQEVVGEFALNPVSVKFYVVRAESVPSGVEVKMPEKFDGVEVPGAGESDNVSSAFTVKVTDQFGDEMENAPAATWSIADAEGNSVDGISVSKDGKITVSAAAKDAVTDTTGTELVLKATVGSGEDAVTDTANVTIKRAGSVVDADSVKIYRGTTEITGTDTVIKPASGDAANEYTYSATAKDQYGADITGLTVAASLNPAVSGISVSGATVSVTSGVTADSANIVVSVSLGQQTPVSKNVTLSIKDIEVVWPTVTVDSDAEYGDTWNDILTVGTNGSANVAGTPVSGTFTVKNGTDKPEAGEQEYIIVFTSNDKKYVVENVAAKANIAPKQVDVKWGSTKLTYNGEEQAPIATAADSNKVNEKDDLTVVVSGAKKDAGSNYTATASFENAKNYVVSESSKNAAFSIAPCKIKVDWSDDDNDFEYDYSSEDIDYSSVKASIEGKYKDGTIELSVSSDEDIKDAGEYTLTASFEAANSNYTLEETTHKLIVNKAEVTPELVAIDSKPYDGNTNATGAELELDGVMGSDSVSATFDCKWTAADAGTTTVDVTNIKIDTDSQKNYVLTTDSLTDVTAPDDACIEKADLTDCYDGLENASQTQDSNGNIKPVVPKFTISVDEDDYTVYYRPSDSDSDEDWTTELPSEPGKYDVKVVVESGDNYGGAVFENADALEIKEYSEPSGGGGGGGVIVTPPSKEKFIDVTKDDWFHDVVYDLVDRGIINGMTENTFEPYGNITRAQFVKILAAMTKADTSQFAGKQIFDDVAPGDWYAPYVAWAKFTGVTTGVSETEFAPEATITRQDMAVMIVRYADYVNKSLDGGSANVTFSDKAQIAGYAMDAVGKMQSSGIINGKGDNTFAPTDNATRAEACAMISRLISKLGL